MADTSDEFRAFAATRSAPLFRTAWLLTGDWHLAEDLAQDTLARMYRSWSGISRIDDPAAYARTVLVRLFISHRRRKSSTERPTHEIPEQPTHDVDATLRLTLMDGLAQLDLKDRAVLVLRYWEDRSVEEAAAALRISPGAVKSRSFRALDRLRAVLGEATDGLSALR